MRISVWSSDVFSSDLLAERNVEGQCGFARARYARDNGKGVARNAYVDAFQIVFTGVDDVYAWRCAAPAFQEALQRGSRAAVFAGRLGQQAGLLRFVFVDDGTEIGRAHV